MDSLTPNGMTIHKRSRTNALLQRARSAPGCLGLMARMHTVHARYKRRFLSANEAAGWAAARRPSFARRVSGCTGRYQTPYFLPKFGKAVEGGLKFRRLLAGHY